MKRSKVVVLAVVVATCVVMLQYALMSQLFFPTESDKDELRYSAEHTIEGLEFRVSLFPNHPLLAEYRKVMKVSKGGKVLLEREFIDTGGLATFYFLRQGDRVLVLDGIRDGFEVDPITGDVSKLDLDLVPRDFAKLDFGRFMFVHEPEWSYRWVARDDLPADAK